MTSPHLPYVAPTATTYVVPCDSHYEEVPATREIHYVAFPGTADEHGSTFAICDDDACEAKARAYIDTPPLSGTVQQIVPVTQPATRTFTAAA